jgi:hypothetical protein
MVTGFGLFAGGVMTIAWERNPVWRKDTQRRLRCREDSPFILATVWQAG